MMKCGNRVDRYRKLPNFQMADGSTRKTNARPTSPYSRASGGPRLYNIVIMVLAFILVLTSDGEAHC
jgi:hypothetical protein